METLRSFSVCCSLSLHSVHMYIIKRVVKMRCCFYRENNKIDAMKTSMCLASDFFLLHLFCIVFIQYNVLIHLNSGNYPKSVHLVDERISHVSKLMILNFTLFNHITTSLVHILLLCIWYVRLDSSSLLNHFGTVWSVAFIPALNFICTISCRFGFFFHFVADAIRIEISLITNWINTNPPINECVTRWNNGFVALFFDRNDGFISSPTDIFIGKTKTSWST